MVLPVVAVIAMVWLGPLSLPSSWERLSYRGIPSNRVTFADGGLTIDVEASASPLVWPLPRPSHLIDVEVRGVVSGQLRTDPDRQGQAGADDFTLRVGLVESGTRRPSFVERRFALSWVRRLFALAPEGGGIGQIRFFNLGLDPSQIGWSRTHPLSNLLHETIVAVPDADGRFSIVAEAPDAPILAIWLSADGDDTRSTFSVRIDRLALR